MNIKSKLSTFYYRAFTCIYGLFHPLENKILFSSYTARQYSDSPRFISEYMHQAYPEYKLVWRLINKEDKYGILPDYISFVGPGVLSFYKELATCRCYITNENNKSFIYKRPGQFFIQTWHGDRPIKKVLLDIESGCAGDKGDTDVTDSVVTDLCVAASDIGESVYRTAFGFKGRILRVGMPRNDILVQNDSALKAVIRERLGLKNEKLLLYAPTYRDNLREKQNATVDIERVLALLERGGEKWICLLRAHSGSMGIIANGCEDRSLDVSDYPDMADLLLIADMLITDYSSCGGDFILTGRPLLLAQFDRDEYSKSCRDFKVDPEAAGFITARSQEQLEDILRNTSNEQYAESCERIIKYFNVYESGHSAEAVCKIIDDFIKSEENG